MTLTIGSGLGINTGIVIYSDNLQLSSSNKPGVGGGVEDFAFALFTRRSSAASRSVFSAAAQSAFTCWMFDAAFA